MLQVIEKTVIFDLETTGLDPHQDGIGQMAFKYYINGELIDTLNIRINPFTYKREIREPSSKALEITGVTIEDLKKGMNAKDAFHILEAWLDIKANKYDKNDKIILDGYNITNFDIPFILDWWIDSGGVFTTRDGKKIPTMWSYFDRYNLDVFATTKLALRSNFFIRTFGKNPDNLQLKTVANFLGFYFTAHDAFGDVEATEFIKNYYQKHFLISD